MKAMVNLLGRLLGAGKILRLVDGSKTYIGAGAQGLAGLAAILSGASCSLAKLAAVGSLADMIGFVKDISHDPCSVTLLGGVALVGKALADAGLRHAISKSEQP